MKRFIEDQFANILESADRRVVLLEGARQVGKSHLVRSALERIDRPSICFDLEKDRKFRHQLGETEDFQDFRAWLEHRHKVGTGSILFIDEAQESPKLAGYIKSFKEDWPEVKVILTGSSMNRLFENGPRYPVGRTRSLCLYGFSFGEFVQCVHNEELAQMTQVAPQQPLPRSIHTLLLELFDQYLQVGGYPEAVLAAKRNEDYREVLTEIVLAQEEDFARKEAYDPELFRMTLRAVANHIGSPSKYTHLDTTKYKAKQVISAMKAWHLLLVTEVRSLDPGRDGFLPKRYLHDPALANLFRTVATPPISLLHTVAPLLRTPLGGLFENAVLLHLLNGLSARTTIGTWKKGNNTSIEVDFVLENNQQRIPVECKAALNLKRAHHKNVLAYLKATGQPLGLTVTAAPYAEQTIDGFQIINLPIYLANRTVIEQIAQRPEKS